MEIGTPLPPDIAEINAAAILNAQDAPTRKAIRTRLQAVHAALGEESQQLHEKRVALRNVLIRIDHNESNANRASFDTILGMGKSSQDVADSIDFTPEGARDMLKNVARGLFQLPTTVIEKLKKIAGGE